MIMVNIWQGLVLGLKKKNSYQRVILGQLFAEELGNIPDDPGRQVYYPATYKGIHLGKGQHYQTRAHSTTQLTLPGRTNRQ